jgi:Flp pilus assembly protein TadD
MQFPTIIAAINAGNPAAAEQLCLEVLSRQPDEEDLLFLLAVSLQLQAKLVEAADIYARLTDLFPAESVYWANYATTLLETGRPLEAEAGFQRSIQCDPKNPFPRVQLGLMLILRKDYVAAREMLLDAFDLDKQSPLARIHAARACCLCQDFSGAQDLLRPWRQWLPMNDDGLQLELSRLLILMSDAAQALPLLEDLVQRDVSNFDAKLLLAGVYERMNRLADAQNLATAISQAGSGLGQAIRQETDHLLAKLALRNGDALAARELLEQSGIRHEGDYTHYFELAEANDKLGERDRALQALRTAHALQVEELKIASPEHFTPDAPALPAAVPRVSLDMYRRWPQTQAPDAHSSPVFIVGFPRSGTTLLEQMLDAHPSLQSMDENPFFNRLTDKLWHHDPRILKNLDALQQRDCDELRKAYLLMASEKIERRWGAQLVDKNPLNMLWVPLIHRLFPQAKYILALRHPCDVILSCYMQNFRSSVLASASASILRLARAYVQAMETWLEDVNIFQPDVLISRYEELIADVPGQTRRIARFLELDDAAPLMNFDQRAREKGYIATPSYSQVIVPVNKKGLGRWHNYRRAFDPALPILEPMLRHWGYDSPVS